MLIQLCDDDRDDVDLFREALGLSMPDCELVVSYTCQDLLDNIHSRIPSLIFLDVNVPEMSGWDCLACLKKDDLLKHIPVILYSTSSSRQDMEMAKELGAVCLMKKPDRFRDLVARLPVIIKELALP